MLLDKKKISNKILSPMERVALSRSNDRPKGKDVIGAITTSFQEIHGDRLMGDDPAVICGIGEVENTRCIIIAQEKGSDTTEKLYHNFGMMGPSGYRKAHRAIKLAERFFLPVIMIIDTPGAYPGLEAEKNGISSAIAENLSMLSDVQTSVTALVLGEGCSGGALGIGVCDRMIMLEHAYYSVISPEGCSSILWKDVKYAKEAATQLKMQSEDLSSFKMIDTVIAEGEGSFSENKEAVYKKIKEEILSSLDILSAYSLPELLLIRYKKYRSF